MCGGNTNAAYAWMSCGAGTIGRIDETQERRTKRFRWLNDGSFLELNSVDWNSDDNSTTVQKT